MFQHLKSLPCFGSGIEVRICVGCRDCVPIRFYKPESLFGELPQINRGLQASTASDSEDFLPTLGLTLPSLRGRLVPNVNNLKP